MVSILPCSWRHRARDKIHSGLFPDGAVHRLRRVYGRPTQQPVSAGRL